MKTTRNLGALAALIFAAGVHAGPVNINTADAPTLAAELQGVGPVVAQRIVEFRKANGEFADASSIVRVRGIGAKTFERNRDSIRVE